MRTYLGRPWRGFASTAFLGTEMSDVVRPEGWNNWDRPLREKTVRYGEWGTTGAGARPDARVAWARRLSDEEARALTPESVLSGADGWNPAAEGERRRPGERRRGRRPRRSRGRSPAPPPARFTRTSSTRARGAIRCGSTPACRRVAGPFPAVLVVHGGGWSGGDRTRAARSLLEPLTRAGVAWLSIDYRLAPKHRYPAPVEDVETAILWVKAQARRLRIDPQRIALLGESAGGHLVAEAAVRSRDDTRVAAVVPFFAPVDLESDTDRRGGLSASLQGLFGRIRAGRDGPRAPARGLADPARPARGCRPSSSCTAPRT